MEGFARSQPTPEEIETFIRVALTAALLFDHSEDQASELGGATPKQQQCFWWQIPENRPDELD